MPITTRYFFTVSMDVAPEKEALFNEVYEAEHVPYLTSVPGVLGATRSHIQPLRMMLAGEKRVMDPGGEPRYSDRFGHPRLRMRHFPFVIDERAAGRERPGPAAQRQNVGPFEIELDEGQRPRFVGQHGVDRHRRDRRRAAVFDIGMLRPDRRRDRHRYG